MMYVFFFVGLAVIGWYVYCACSTGGVESAVEEKASDEAGICGEAKP